MKTKLLALVLLAGSSMFAGTRVVVGVGVPGYGYGYYAAPPPPPVVAYVGPRYGYFRAPYPRAYWVGPRYYGHRYYRGYWHR
ncbi:MAG: hypothetical protein ABSE86_24520 [Bryobacteraceae bacterium]|jgi:hypothetical protein